METVPCCSRTGWLWFAVTTSPCAGRHVPGTGSAQPAASVGAALPGKPAAVSGRGSAPCSQQISAFLAWFWVFLKRLRCHMALAVLPSARHSLALLLSNSAPSPKSKILTLDSTGGMGAASCRERGCVPQICAERGGRRSWVS